MRDDAFVRFLDLFNNRFLQLFFRAWADSRPIAHRDRPSEDRFVAYVGTTVGLGSPIYYGLDTVADSGKLAFAGLMGAQAKSASRLKQLIAGVFGVKVEVEEFVGSYLKLDAGDRTSLGQQNASLGRDILVGSSVFSVQDKIRVRVFSRNLGEYMQFLPTGARSEPLVDLVFFYIGEQLDWDIELALPSAEVNPIRLSQFGQLGWTTWIASDTPTTTQEYRCDARFNPAERLRQKRIKRAA
jgi:type VI secretion system protein ImpH